MTACTTRTSTCVVSTRTAPTRQHTPHPDSRNAAGAGGRTSDKRASTHTQDPYPEQTKTGGGVGALLSAAHRLAESLRLSCSPPSDACTSYPLAHLRSPCHSPSAHHATAHPPTMPQPNRSGTLTGGAIGGHHRNGCTVCRRACERACSLRLCEQAGIKRSDGSGAARGEHAAGVSLCVQGQGPCHCTSWITQTTEQFCQSSAWYSGPVPG